MSALVQSISGANGAGATTVVGTLGAVPTAGNSLYAIIGVVGTTVTVTSVTSTGATWALAWALTSGTTRVECWYAENVPASGAAITANLSQSREAAIIIGEFYGPTTTTLDKTATNSNDYGTSTPATTGSTAATTQAQEIIVAGLADITLAGTWDAPGSSFIELLQKKGGTSLNLTFEYKFVAATGAQSLSLTRTPQPVAGAWVGGIATFKSQAGTGSASNHNLLSSLGVG